MYRFGKDVCFAFPQEAVDDDGNKKEAENFESTFLFFAKIYSALCVPPAPAFPFLLIILQLLAAAVPFPIN